MNPEHLEQLKHIDTKVRVLSDSLDRHLEIYANNGVESARVADNLEELLRHAEERDKKIDDMWADFIGEKYAKNKNRDLGKDIVLFAGVLGAIGVIVLVAIKLSIK